MQLIAYQGADFNGIFAGLDAGIYDCIASGIDDYSRPRTDRGLLRTLCNFRPIARRRSEAAIQTCMGSPISRAW